MMLPWKREAIIAPRRPVSTKKLEFEAAKHILSEVFHLRPGDIEQMIPQRLEEKIWLEGREDGLWPGMF